MPRMPAGIGTPADAAERWLRPCAVDSLATPIPNFKHESAASFGAVVSSTTGRLRRLQSSEAETSGPEAPAPLVAALDPHRLCTESQITFTVPPTTPPFHIRFRVDVDGRKGAWENPLTWEDGYFFSPRLHGAMSALAIPPAVLLSRAWEKANVEGKWAWQEQIARPEEGELRLFTLAGLTPSVVTSGVSGWLVGKAGQGLFGTRTVELEFAEAVLSWEASTQWTLLEPLKYKLPAADAVTALLTIALNWGRSHGVQKMQEALVSELGRKNRKANLRMIRDFVKDTHEKLLPVWHSSVEPWMAQNPTLAVFIAERRSEMMRRRAVELLEYLANRGMVQGIPSVLVPIRPKILNLQCIVDGSSLDTSACIEIHEGQGLVLSAQAQPMAADPADVKLWWLIPSTNEPGLDMAALIGNQEGAHFGPGGKVRLQRPDFPSCSQGATVCSEVQLSGQNRWGNPALQAGIELVIRVLAEEHGAHEDDSRDVRLRVIGDFDLDPQLERSTSFESCREESGFQELPPENHPDPELACRRTAPYVLGIAKPSSIVKEHFAAALKQGKSTLDSLRVALEAANFSPTQMDLNDALSHVQEDADTAAKLDNFETWYNDSVFGRTLLEETWNQVKDSLRCRRNSFLAETLEIPPERWGFQEDEWGGILPEMGLMRQHMSCVAKRQLAVAWQKRESVAQRPPPADDAGGSNEIVDEPQMRSSPQLQMEDHDAVDRATLLAVSEAFGVGMAKHYMSQLLPSASFTEEKRKEWVSAAVREQSLKDSAAQLLAFRLAEYYRIACSEETATAREAAAAAAAAREAEATRWLESWRRAGPDAGPPPEDLIEVAKVVAKTTVQQEVACFLESQLLPMVRTQLRERIFPALLSELRQMAVEVLLKPGPRRVVIGLAVFTGTSLLAAVTLGPWAAVFWLLRKVQVQKTA